MIVWNKAAENCSKYLAKGRAVFVEGKVQTRAWEDKNGQKRYTTEISANNVQFMPGGESSRNESSAARGEQFDSSAGESRVGNLPPAASTQESAPQKQSSAGMGMSLDDIPF